MSNEIRVDFSQTGASTTQAVIRSHKVIVDRPEAKGGSDEGPMGGELLLAGLGGCFLSNLLAAARARETPLEGVSATVIGVMEGVPPRFARIRIELRGAGAPEELRKLAVVAERGCLVANTLKPAVTIEVNVVEAPQ